MHRADMHDSLLEKAKALGVEIKTGYAVKEFDPNTPKAITSDGTEFEADVIFAADGTLPVSPTFYLN